MRSGRLSNTATAAGRDVVTYGRTDGRTHFLEEMKRRIYQVKQELLEGGRGRSLKWTYLQTHVPTDGRTHPLKGMLGRISK